MCAKLEELEPRTSSGPLCRFLVAAGWNGTANSCATHAQLVGEMRAFFGMAAAAADSGGSSSVPLGVD